MQYKNSMPRSQWWEHWGQRGGAQWWCDGYILQVQPSSLVVHHQRRTRARRRWDISAKKKNHLYCYWSYLYVKCINGHFVPSTYKNSKTGMILADIYLHVSLQLIDRHWEIRVVVVVECHITAGLVQHWEQGTQAPQAGEVHDVLHLGGMLYGLDHQTCGGEVRL